MKWKLKFKEIIISRMAFCPGKTIFEKPGRFGRATEGNGSWNLTKHCSNVFGWQKDVESWHFPQYNICSVGRLVEVLFGPATHFLRPRVLYCIYILSNNMNLDARLAGCPQDHLHLPHGGPDGHGRDHANWGDNLAVPVHCWKNQTRRRVQVEQKEW